MSLSSTDGQTVPEFGATACEDKNVYNAEMDWVWDEAKRQSNLNKHGLDFRDAERVFAGPLLLFEDVREDYGDERMIAVGLLDALVVLIVHVESDEFIRIISMRKANNHETELFFKNAGIG